MSDFTDLDDAEFDAMVADEVKGAAPEGFAEWVREPDNLIDWLYSLRVLDMKVDRHIHRSKAMLAALKPPPGVLPDDEYLNAKREHDAEHRGRVRFIHGVKERIVEARRLIALEGALVLLKEGDAEAVADILGFTLDRLSGGVPA
jgi:hypothetical protein